MQYIHSNPTRNIKLTGQIPEKKSNKTISIDDLTKFKEALLSRENTTSKYFILVQLYTGARYQEVAALTWDSIDESNEVIKIKMPISMMLASIELALQNQKQVFEILMSLLLFLLFKNMKLNKRKSIERRFT